MRVRWTLLGTCLVGAIAFGLLWVTGGLAGKPTLPPSDANGTERVFAIDEVRALVAISNAFRLFRYHDMMLSDAIGSDYLTSHWHPTNGFILLPTVSTLGTVPTKGILGNRQLEYVATFCITCTGLTTNKTTINVRTVTAKVLDGIKLGHAGTVANTAKVPAVRQEEDNVLNAIEAELASETKKTAAPSK